MSIIKIDFILNIFFFQMNCIFTCFHLSHINYILHGFHVATFLFVLFIRKRMKRKKKYKLTQQQINFNQNTSIPYGCNNRCSLIVIKLV